MQNKFSSPDDVFVNFYSEPNNEEKYIFCKRENSQLGSYPETISAR